MSTNPISEELLACPFCGSPFKMGQEPHDNHPVGGMFYLYHEYGPLGSAARACPLDVNRHFETAEEAATAWNHRAADSHSEPVQDTWFTDSSLPVVAMSADTESDRVLKLHFRRAVTDADRRSMTDALNLHQQSLKPDSRANQAVVTEEVRQAAIDVDLWLKSALECREWVWDGDQRAAAEDARTALTAALSRAEGQEPVAYLHKPTGNVFKAAEFRPLLTAWQRQFADTHAAEEIEADFLPLYRSALVEAPAPAVPDGWKLVPVEPTEAMKVAAFGPIIEGGRGGPITKDFLRQEIGIGTFKAMIAAAPLQPVATHRHKKSGGEYVLLGIGKMQAKHWVDKKPSIDALMKEPPASVPPPSVDMHPVAIYQSTDDGSFWARPIEEWEDGRFEVLATSSQPLARGQGE
ncbi:Lar family restriction alleviation protein [Paradevosia shaoguanensis]|uniref:Lar family restriction alleviation protein n=1 Tax=Paradevosia shaoguanensis TaxID=1335043 RepID=UPI001931C1AF|nr:Lar family restriction alleviation protein [Paradevosia shaoguanensis]